MDLRAERREGRKRKVDSKLRTTAKERKKKRRCGGRGIYTSLPTFTSTSRACHKLGSSTTYRYEMAAFLNGKVLPKQEIPKREGEEASTTGPQRQVGYAHNNLLLL